MLNIRSGCVIPVGYHDWVDGGRALLDPTVEPPVLGVGLLHGVVTRLVGLDGHDLLDEAGHTLGAATDLLTHVVELVEATRTGDDLKKREGEKRICNIITFWRERNNRKSKKEIYFQSTLFDTFIFTLVTFFFIFY